MDNVLAGPFVNVRPWLNRLAVLLFGLAVCLGAPLASAQPDVQLQAPHQLIQHTRPAEAEALTEQRDWRLHDGTLFRGSLIRWSDLSGLVYLNDQHRRPKVIPGRQFDDATRAEIDQLLAPHRELMEQLSEKEPIREPIELTPSSGSIPAGAFPVDLSDGFIRWRFTDGYFQSPTKLFAEKALKQLKTAIAERDGRPTWTTVLAGASFQSQLVGKTSRALVFRGVNRAGSYYQDLGFRFDLQLLAPEDRERAKRMLAAMPDGGMIADEKAPPWWRWPAVASMGPTLQPVAIKGDFLVVRKPDVRAQPAQASSAASPGRYPSVESRISLKYLSSLEQLHINVLLEEKRLLAANPDFSSAERAKLLDQYQAKLIAEDPFRYLSPIDRWSVRDVPADQTVAGRLIGEVGPYWIFRQDDDPTPFALLKQEIPEDLVQYGERVLQQLDRYLQTHPEVKRPTLETRFRVVRHLLGQPRPRVYEPVAFLARDLDPKGTLELRPLSATENDPATTASSQHLHFMDVQELELILNGSVQLGQSAEQAPLDREKQLKLQELRQLKSEQAGWLLQSQEDRGRILLGASLVGQHQNDLVLRQTEVEFLVDRGILADQSKEQADRMLAKLTELREAVGAEEAAQPMEIPQLRLWGHAHGKFLIGKDPRFSKDGSLKYTAVDGTQTSVEAYKIPDELKIEIQTQVAADQNHRLAEDQQWSAARQKELLEFKQKTRDALAKQIAEDVMPQWQLKDNGVLLAARFEQFAGADVIFRNEDEQRFRVYRISLTDETLDKLEQLARRRAEQGDVAASAALDPAEVRMRVLRMDSNGLSLPARPVAVDPDYLYLQSAHGRTFRHDRSDFHPRDFTEVRSSLYLEQHGLERDTGIDDRLAQPVKPDEVMTASVPLAPQWRERLDAIAQPRRLVWDETPLSTVPGEEVVAISPDAAAVAVRGKRSGIRVVDVAAGTSSSVQRPNSGGTDDQGTSWVWIADKNRLLCAWQNGRLQQWSIAGKQRPHIYKQLDEQPIGACQSADGSQIFLLGTAGQLSIVTPGSREVRELTVTTPSGAELLPNVWCSADGSRFAVATFSDVQTYRWDAATDSYLTDQTIGSATRRPMIAFGEQYFVITSPMTPGFAVVADDDGRTILRSHTTGLLPAWLGTRKDGERNLVQVIGQRGDPRSQAADYSFCAWFGVTGQVRRATQSINGTVTLQSPVAASGNAAAVKQADGWKLTVVNPLSESQFAPLNGIARDLVETSRVDQVDAAWQYLRREPFQKLGEYPDQASEHFLEYLLTDIETYGWQHGGDLNRRAGLLLDRWKRLAPDSLAVPAMLAIRQRDAAWRARGSGFADTVNREEFEEFDTRMRQVAQLVKPLFAAENPPTRAYRLAFEVAMSLGLPMETVKRLNGEMMKTPVRFSTTAHTAVVLLLLPRWHGEPGDSENYLTGIANRLGGDVGDQMYAALTLFAAKFYPSNEPLRYHLKVDYDRLLKGLQIYYRQPHSDVYLKRTLNILAQEQRWDLYRQVMQLRVDRRIFQEEDAESFVKHQKQEQKALAPE